MATHDFRTRVKALQTILQVTADGDFGPVSARAFMQMAQIPMPQGAPERKQMIKAIQQHLSCAADGILGPLTLSRMEAFVSPTLPALPQGSSMRVSQKGMDLLISFEVSSPAQYERNFRHPVWPGGESGITVGIGYDLGYVTRAKASADWQGQVNTPEHLTLLASCAGKKGRTAQTYLSQVRTVDIPYAAALSVFYQVTLPTYARLTRKTYPGVEKLPPDAQSALLSLVYNRGASLSGATRVEMKNIVSLVAARDLKGIAREILNMKRLWVNKGLPGLLTRRDKEAEMVANASYFILPEMVILV